MLLGQYQGQTHDGTLADGYGESRAKAKITGSAQPPWGWKGDVEIRSAKAPEILIPKSRVRASSGAGVVGLGLVAGVECGWSWRSLLPRGGCIHLCMPNVLTVRLPSSLPALPSPGDLPVSPSKAATPWALAATMPQYGGGGGGKAARRNDYGS